VKYLSCTTQKFVLDTTIQRGQKKNQKSECSGNLIKITNFLREKKQGAVGHSGKLNLNISEFQQIFSKSTNKKVSNLCCVFNSLKFRQITLSVFFFFFGWPYEELNSAEHESSGT